MERKYTDSEVQLIASEYSLKYKNYPLQSINAAIESDLNSSLMPRQYRRPKFAYAVKRRLRALRGK